MPRRMLTAEHVRAARALLGWGQRELAQAAGLSVPTIKRVEASQDVIQANYATVLAIQTALESAGIEFVHATDGRVGVTLKKKLPPAG